MTMYATIDSPLGELLLVGEEAAAEADGAAGGVALASLSMPGQKGPRSSRPAGSTRLRPSPGSPASCGRTSRAG